MKNKWNKRGAILTAAALALMAGATAGKAVAYFTTYVIAEGGQELHLGFTTTIPDEEVDDGRKDITIQNTGENACYVRVKAFAGDAFKLAYVDQSGGNWSAGEGGYWYWHGVLAPNDETGVLRVNIDKGDAEQSFNVIVVQECAPVLYDEKGDELTWDQIDWDQEADIVVKTDTGESLDGEEDTE